MSLSHWESEDGQRAFLAIGLIVNRSGLADSSYYLDFENGQWIWRFVGGPVGNETDSVAHALLQKHAREWLNARKVVVVPDWTGGEAYYWRYQCQNDGPWKMVTGGHPDYDAALIAAILAEGLGLGPWGAT